jgi:hypothetical protein
METFEKILWLTADSGISRMLAIVLFIYAVYYLWHHYTRIQLYKKAMEDVVEMAREAQYNGVGFALNQLIHQIHKYTSISQLHAQADSWCDHHNKYLKGYKLYWDRESQSFLLLKLEGKPKRKFNRELIVFSKTGKAKTYAPKDFCKFNPN